MKPRMLIALAATAALTLAACGDDDDDAASEATTAAPATTQAPATTAAPATTQAPATTAAPATTEAPATTTASSEMSAESSGTGEAADPYCALALEMANQDSQPTPEQLTQAQELAPTEIKDAADVAAPALAAATSLQEFFAIYAEDDVEQAVEEINAYEDANCGTDHSDESPPEAPGVSKEVEADATEVDVVAGDYSFDMPDTVDAGRTSFVLTNEGNEAHFLLIVKLSEGVALADALESEDDSMIEGIWETGIAAPGGTDDEAITFDLEAGNYGALCFIPGPDGTPHAFMGMQKEFTVS